MASCCPQPQPGTLIKTDHLQTQNLTARFSCRGTGTPHRIRPRSQLRLQIPPPFSYPPLNSISHDRISTSFGHHDGHTATLSRLFSPVKFKLGATLSPSFTTDGQKLRPTTKNARPRQAPITPRCGGRSGAPHLWVEGDDDHAHDDARSRHALP